MVDVATILAVAIATVAIIGFGWYVKRSLREDFEDATEHIESDDPQKGGASIPITARASGLSFTAKVLFGSVAGIFIIIAVFAFQTIRQGSPAEVMFASQLFTAGQVVAGATAGIILVNYAHQSEGRLINVYERDNGEVKTEEVPVDTTGLRTDGEGNPVVTEYASTRLFGLFRRVRHVGEDAELAGTHRAPGKPIRHQIPDHAVEVEEGVWINRTARRSATEAPDIEADYIYSSPIELSYDAYVNMKEAKRRQDIRLQNLEATVAVLEKELEKLTRRLKSGQYKEEQQVLDKIEQVVDIVDAAGGEDTDRREPRATHVSLDQNGSDTSHQEATTDGGNK